MIKPLYMRILWLLLPALFSLSACQDPGCIRNSECKRNYTCKRSKCTALDGGVEPPACTGLACALDAGAVDRGAGAVCTGLACAIDAGAVGGTAGEMSAAEIGAAAVSGGNTESGAAAASGTAGESP